MIFALLEILPISHAVAHSLRGNAFAACLDSATLARIFFYRKILQKHT